jgi:hypothetical protein
MYAIEISFEKGWWNLWVETDFKLVSLAFKSPFMVPWFLRTDGLTAYTSQEAWILSFTTYLERVIA